jgi:hypothetical protein
MRGTGACVVEGADRRVETGRRGGGAARRKSGAARDFVNSECGGWGKVGRLAEKASA